MKNIKLSNILNLFTNQSQNIVLIRDLPLKEKEEKRIIAELYHQKFFLENKINYLLNNLDGNINAKCEILPSFELASNNIELFPDCYKQKMEDLVYTILTNIKYDRTLTGNKLIEIIYELLEIFKNVNNIEILKNDENKLDLILLELFKEKVKKIYLDINDKIDKFDKYIINLNGKPESIKNFLIENIKNEIKNTWEIYDKKIHNEIIQQLEIITYQIEVNIKSALEKEKDKMTNDIFSIIDINNNKEIMNYLSQITYKEEINQNKIKELLDNIINNFSNKYKLYFEYTDVTDKNYKTKTIEYIKSILNKNINYIIESKPNWENSLRKLIYEIQLKIINPYKNDLIKQSKKEIENHLNNILDNLLMKKIQIYIADIGIKIFKIGDLKNELNYLFETIKKELSNQIKLIEGKINEEKLQKRILYSMTIPNGIYFIFSAQSRDKVLDIPNSSKENNTKIQLSYFNDSNAQKFKITYDISEKCYTIKRLNSDKYITLNESNNTLVQFSEKNNTTQQWHIVNVGEYYEIISESNGKLIEISESQTKDVRDYIFR